LLNKNETDKKGRKKEEIEGVEGVELRGHD
jgi:hypothetical protein